MDSDVWAAALGEMTHNAILPSFGNSLISIMNNSFARADFLATAITKAELKAQASNKFKGAQDEGKIRTYQQFVKENV